MAYSTDAIQPGDTFWTGTYRLIPEISGILDLGQSFVQEAAGVNGPAATIEPQTPVAGLPLTVSSVSGGLHLSWTAPSVSGITGYEIYETPTRDTLFGATPIATVPAGTTSTTIAHAPAGYYAVSTETTSGLTLYNNLAGSPGLKASSTKTTLTVSPKSITVGSETAETLTVKLTSSGGTPSGQITVKDSKGQAICSAVGLNAQGEAICTLSASQLRGGNTSSVPNTRPTMPTSKTQSPRLKVSR